MCLGAQADGGVLFCFTASFPRTRIMGLLQVAHPGALWLVSSTIFPWAFFLPAEFSVLLVIIFMISYSSQASFWSIGSLLIKETTLARSDTGSLSPNEVDKMGNGFLIMTERPKALPVFTVVHSFTLEMKPPGSRFTAFLPLLF